MQRVLASRGEHMAETKTEGQVRKPRKQRQERRFVATSATTSWLTLGGTIVGALLLGAGIYSQWLSSRPWQHAPWIVGIGAAVLAVVILWGDFGGKAVRVGDAGVAVESPSQPLRRMGWYLVESITIQQGELRILGPDTEIRLPIKGNEQAVAWVVKEARARIPKKVDISKDDRKDLPEPGEHEGATLTIEKLQLTGMRCKASGKVITFEKDARSCPRCGQIYHQESVPEACLTCEADLSSAKPKAT